MTTTPTLELTAQNQGDTETVTAFEILESHVQGRAIPLETQDRGLAIFGVVAGIGLSVGLTWGGLLPAISGWDPSDSDFDGYGFIFGLSAGAAAHILAVSIANLAYPRSDLRTAYSSVLDVVDPAEREKAAVSTLQGFGEQSTRRRTLGAILAVVAVSAPIAAYVGINSLIGNLGEYADFAWGFAGGAGLLLLGTAYYFIEEDPAALLYRRYVRAMP